VNIYKRQISNEKTRARAEELVTKLNAGDASAAEATPFKAAEGTLTRKNLNESHGFYARDMEAVFAGLGALREKQVLAPQRTYGGYVLVRMDSRKLPSGDDAAAAREEARKNLKAQREQEALADFYEQVQARADVKNLHSVLTGQRD